MAHRSIKGRVVVLWAALVLAGSANIAPSRANLFDPAHDRSATMAGFGVSGAADFALALLPTSPAPEPFRAELGSSGNTSLDAKWRNLNKSLAREQSILQRCREDAATCPAAARAFLSIVDRAENRSGRARIAEINRSINLGIRAVSDSEQYGIRDLWATPLQMFASRAGDCEDLAIAKYAALRKLGYAETDLRLIIVNDNVAGDIHAVMAVRHDQHWLILDNRTLEIKDEASHLTFEPLFMIGSNGVSKITALSPINETAPWTLAIAPPVPLYTLAAWPMMSPSL